MLNQSKGEETNQKSLRFNLLGGRKRCCCLGDEQTLCPSRALTREKMREGKVGFSENGTKLRG